MALFNCPECRKEISDKANSCPYCGLPFNQSTEFVFKSLEPSAQPLKNKQQSFGCGTVILIVFLIGFLSSIFIPMMASYRSKVKSA